MHKALEVQYGGWPWERVNGAADSNFVLIGACSGSESNHCAVYVFHCRYLGRLAGWHPVHCNQYYRLGDSRMICTSPKVQPICWLHRREPIRREEGG